MALNVRGLKSKLKSDDFEKYICNFDIVCLSENKTTMFDNIYLLSEAWQGTR